MLREKNIENCVSDLLTHEDGVDEYRDDSAIALMQLVLAEKRTSLSVLRSGVALMSLPMSIVTLLIATSKLYDLYHNLHFVIPLLVLNSFLAVIGISLIIRAWNRIKRQDKMIEAIKKHAPHLSKLINEVSGDLIKI